jgi:hypothetical protein
MNNPLLSVLCFAAAAALASVPLHANDIPPAAPTAQHFDAPAPTVFAPTFALPENVTPYEIKAYALESTNARPIVNAKPAPGFRFHIELPADMLDDYDRPRLLSLAYWHENYGTLYASLTRQQFERSAYGVRLYRDEPTQRPAFRACPTFVI